MPYQLLGLKLLVLNAGRQANTGLTPGWNIIFNYKTAPSGIQTWDLSICLYLNLKHGDLYRSATTASLQYWLITCRRNWIWCFVWKRKPTPASYLVSVSLLKLNMVWVQTQRGIWSIAQAGIRSFDVESNYWSHLVHQLGLITFLKWQPCHFPVMAFCFIVLIYLKNC